MTELETKDGHIFIKASVKQRAMQKAGLLNESSEEHISGSIKVTHTPEYDIILLSNEIKDLKRELGILHKAQTETQEVLDKCDKQEAKDTWSVEFSAKKKKKKKKQGKHKKKKHKNKKDVKVMSNKINDSLSERNEKNSNLMAELFKKTDELVIIDNCLWSYNDETGCYDIQTVESIATKLRMQLSCEEKLKVSFQEYKEAYNQLMISEELVSTKEFFANKPYVNCINGVVDLNNNELLKHSHSYMFKHYIRANYNPDAKCEKFLEYVERITDGDDELKELLQVMLGYIMSHYNNAKTAFLLYGVSHTGKSVICNILENIIGKEYVSNADLSKLHMQEYAADLSGKLLNIAPDLNNEALENVGFFKSLVSHNDTISARKLYSNPEKIKGETKMLFSSNHLLNFDNTVDVEDIEAVFNRFIYFPFQNKPIVDKDDNKNFSEELLNEETDGIFTWAMDGLGKYIKNGEVFPNAKRSQKVKQKNMAQYCPEKTFFEKCILLDENAFESTEVIKESYNSFCDNNAIISKGNIKNFIKNHKRITTTKKRIDDNGNPLSSGNPRAVYVGIRLKDKYRVV